MISDPELPPYRPLHPIREGFTMGLCFMLIVNVVFLLWTKGAC